MEAFASPFEKVSPRTVMAGSSNNDWWKQITILKRFQGNQAKMEIFWDVARVLENYMIVRVLKRVKLYVLCQYLILHWLHKFIVMRIYYIINKPARAQQQLS